MSDMLAAITTSPSAPAPAGLSASSTGDPPGYRPPFGAVLRDSLNAGGPASGSAVAGRGGARPRAVEHEPPDATAAMLAAAGQPAFVAPFVTQSIAGISMPAAAPLDAAAAGAAGEGGPVPTGASVAPTAMPAAAGAASRPSALSVAGASVHATAAAPSADGTGDATPAGRLMLPRWMTPDVGLRTASLGPAVARNGPTITDAFAAPAQRPVAPGAAAPAGPTPAGQASTAGVLWTDEVLWTDGVLWTDTGPVPPRTLTLSGIAPGLSGPSVAEPVGGDIAERLGDRAVPTPMAAQVAASVAATPAAWVDGMPVAIPVDTAAPTAIGDAPVAEAPLPPDVPSPSDTAVEDGAGGATWSPAVMKDDDTEPASAPEPDEETAALPAASVGGSAPADAPDLTAAISAGVDTATGDGRAPRNRPAFVARAAAAYHAVPRDRPAGTPVAVAAGRPSVAAAVSPSPAGTSAGPRASAPGRIVEVQIAQAARLADLATPVRAVDQVASALAIEIRNGRTEATIALRPAALGEVRARISDGPDGLVIHLTAEQDAVGDLLRARVGELRAALAGHAVTVSEVNVLHNPPAMPAPAAGDGVPWQERPWQRGREQPSGDREPPAEDGGDEAEE